MGTGELYEQELQFKFNENWLRTEQAHRHNV
jgi:hypothetical protein